MFDDIKAKLDLVSQKTGWNKNSVWAEELGLSPSAVSNWRSGGTISEKHLQKIADSCDLTLDDFSLPLELFSERIGIPLTSTLSITSGIIQGELTAADNSLLRSLSDRYYAFYMGRTEEPGRVAGFYVEEMELGDLNPKIGRAILQRDNAEVGGSSGGVISASSERLFAYHTYEYYPPSYYLLAAFGGGQSAPILYGIYVDIIGPPRKEIFGAKVIWIPQNILGTLPPDRFLRSDSNIYKLLYPLLHEQSELTEGVRLAVPAERKIDEYIQKVVDQLREGSPPKDDPTPS